MGRRWSNSRGPFLDGSFIFIVKSLWAIFIYESISVFFLLFQKFKLFYSMGLYISFIFFHCFLPPTLTSWLKYSIIREAFLTTPPNGAPCYYSLLLPEPCSVSVLFHVPWWSSMGVPGPQN